MSSSSCFIYDSETELAPFSPASSVSLMSVGSDPSPSPSPTSPGGISGPRYNNIYEERLLPLLPSVTEPNRNTKPIPHATHKHFNKNKQAKFDNALRNCDFTELQDLLSCHSEDIDVNLINEDGNTPVQAAAISGNLDIVRLLIRCGADPSLTSRDGWSTLHLAAYSGHTEITQYIMINSRR